MEKKLVKPSLEVTTNFAKETATVMMQAMGQAKAMGLLKTDEDMLDLIAVGLVEVFEQYTELMEVDDSASSSIIL